MFISQLLLTGATLLIVSIGAVAAPHLFSKPLLVAAIIVICVATALAAVVPWRNIAPGWVVLLPVADILAIGFGRQFEAGISASFLFVFPVIWMSAMFSKQGAVGSVALVTGVLWTAAVFDIVPGGITDLARLVLLPALLAFVAGATYLTAQRADAQQQLLTQQAKLIGSALRHSRRQERTLDEIFNTVDFGVVGFDRNARVSFVNQAQRDIHARFGAAGDGSGLEHVYQADGVTLYENDDRPDARALRGEMVDRVPVWVGAPGGEQAALLVSTRALFDESGRPDGGVIVSRDVTAELRAISSRDDLIDSVSHELRTPLTSILGYLELVRDDGGLEPHIRSMLDITSANADRLLAIVSGLLAAAGDSKQAFLLIQAPCDLSTVISSAVQSVRPLATRQGVTVHWQPRTLAPLHADALRLRQVLDNLLANAVKYNVPYGSITVSLQASQAGVEVRVTDTGRGISAEEQTGLFTRHYRADSVRGSSVHGTGLGLSISREIARQHGGELRLESRPGEGATLILTLPLQREGH